MSLRLYAVRNTDGEWFRAVGYGGSGKSWVTELGDAKLYTKLGTARGRVTYFASRYPDRPAPKIVMFVLPDAGIELEDDERVAKALAKKTREAEALEERRRIRDLESARTELIKARKTIAKLKKEKGL